MFAGIDIGGTNIKYGITDEHGTILFQESKPTDSTRGQEILIEEFRSIIRTILEQFPATQSIGIGFPSVVNPYDGCVHYPPNLPGWTIVPLVGLLQQDCPVPVAIDNDANVAALAESEAGAGRDASHFLYVTWGTGIGGGIIINNKIYTGESGGAGEIGHIVMDVFEQPTDEMERDNRLYRAGTLEENLGRPGFIRFAKKVREQYPDSLLHTYGEELDIHHISEGVEKNDAAAREIFITAGTWMGLGLAGMLAILDMHIIVIGGGISLAHPLLLDTVLNTLQQRALPTIAKRVELRKAHFTYNAGIVGAAMLGKVKMEQSTK